VSRASLWFIIVEEERRDGSVARHITSSTLQYGRDAVAAAMRMAITEATKTIRSVEWESMHDVADMLIADTVKDHDPIRMDRVRDLLEHAQAMVQMVEGPGCGAWFNQGKRLKDQQAWANFYCSVKALEALEKAP
jgi:flavin-binding protein dodecin